MNRRHVLLAVAVAAAMAASGALAWWLGWRQGQQQQLAHPAATAPAAAAPRSDPAQWSPAQAEEATRRHLRDGLKAGDLDPVTGLRVLHYHDPMVPGKTFDAPGKSPFMDMLLVPRYAGAGAGDAAGVAISPRQQQNLGLRTVVAAEGTLAAEVAAVGQVVWNERLQRVVAARAMGFVERLHVRAAQDRVAAGAPLLDIRFPDWVAAQEDYLAVARMSGEGVAALRDAARARMRQAGMDEALVERVAREGRVIAQATLNAPIDGLVSELMVREGATVMPGMALLRLQGTATVWADGQVPEAQTAALRVGLPVRATSPALPGLTLEGRVQSLLPEVDAATRTLRVRLELANPGARLVPGMTLQMRFAQPGRARALLLPSDAVIQTGRRSLVMLAEDGGRFRPLEVVTGLESGGQIEILRGLQPGQRVVATAQFLVDSEASLRGLQARLEPAPGAAPASASASAPAAVDPAPPRRHRTGARIDSLDGDSAMLAHPAIAALKWPAMTMEFRLPPPAQRPPGLAAGQQVEVEFETRDDGVPQILAIRRVGTGAAR